jgi:predicted phosphate transport protein (TIGR00153 family)
MAINTIFSFLIPKENKFFPLINEVGLVLDKTAKILIDFIKSDKTQMEGLYAKIKACETEADLITDTIFEELNNTFITPFDREDIQALCERLDDIVDAINSCSKRILIFQPKIIPPAAVKMCEIISDSCMVINAALQELKNIHKNTNTALEYCHRLHELEHDGDDLYEEYIKHLFETERNGIELLKLKEIIQELERATDITYSVGKIIKTIVVKYA